MQISVLDERKKMLISGWASQSENPIPFFRLLSGNKKRETHSLLVKKQ